LQGLDEIGLTLAMDRRIADFETSMRADRPWL
jgi:3-isopropylmalate dehydratase small subunit